VLGGPTTSFDESKGKGNPNGTVKIDGAACPNPDKQRSRQCKSREPKAPLYEVGSSIWGSLRIAGGTRLSSPVV
jgi:hypothetical protein